MCKKKYIFVFFQLVRRLGIDLETSKVIESTLDDWAINSDQIVLNCKLGTGMFGVVLGGHVRMNDETGNETYVPVAVKSLKNTSNVDARLDFLCEAETMKRLDHPNIVKLLGVSLDSEPIYTIMELMVLGDLKSYLLKRRNLVSSPNILGDDCEVSPKRLTNMVLDVARGLSYLAHHKFVHRDLACRNCLVTGNGQPVVKLADFGMTRNIFESDNYTFRRTAPLPIRWSAPESLNLGVYTPASDVWSFGIVIWEVITFGLEPYQGLSISEVFRFIAMGHVMNIPAAANPELELLIQKCWLSDSKLRPRACDIAEYVANYPRLVTPCLETSFSSMQVSIMDGGISMRHLDDVRTTNNLSEPNEELSRNEYMDMLNSDNVQSPLLQQLTVKQTKKYQKSMWTIGQSFLRKIFGWRDNEMTHL